MSAVSGNLVVKSKLSSRKLALQPCRSWNSSTKRDHIFFKVFALFYNILIHSVRLMEWAWEVQARILNSDIPKKRQAWQEKKKTEIMTVTKYAGFQGNATIPVKTREKNSQELLKKNSKWSDSVLTRTLLLAVAFLADLLTAHSGCLKGPSLRSFGRANISTWAGVLVVFANSETGHCT